MPANAVTGEELEADLARFNLLAVDAHIRLSPLPESTIPDYVLDEDGEEPLDVMVEDMIADGATEAWLAEMRFDESLEDDRLEDFLDRRGVDPGSLVCFAVYWTFEGAIRAWDMSTQVYDDAIKLLVADPDGVIHVDEDFIARMHAKEEAPEAELRAVRVAVEEHLPFFVDLILNDQTYRGLPRRERMARARELLRQLPAESDARHGKGIAADRAYRQADAVVRNEIGKLWIPEIGLEFANWSGWDPDASADEQREQAQAYFMQNFTQGWRVHKDTCERLLVAARRADGASV